jgi:hypothetical protein
MGALAVAILGPKVYAYGAGLASKLGVVGAIGFLIGSYIGFLQATLDFTAYEESQW